jgi:peroxiredoxin
VYFFYASSGEIGIRKPAPAWAGKAVLNDEIIDLSSESLKGKWVVLFFYPLDFTFVCPTEIVEFNNKYKEFKKLGAEVVGVSVDSPHTHLAWTRTDRKDGGVGKLDFPVSSTPSHLIPRACTSTTWHMAKTLEPKPQRQMSRGPSPPCSQPTTRASFEPCTLPYSLHPKPESHTSLWGGSTRPLRHLPQAH